MHDIPILYEDADILILDKPSGLAVQGGEGVKVALIDLLARDLPYRPLLVHRLDRETSGCLLVAKNAAAATRCSRIIAGREARKVYGAVCSGCPASTTGVIDQDIRVRGEAKTACTRYAVKGSGPDWTLLELELDTGRMHQIRIHLAGIGHPILGDDKYGDFPLNRRLKREAGLRRLLLHARALQLPPGAAADPKAALSVEAPWPEAFNPYIA